MDDEEAKEGQASYCGDPCTYETGGTKPDGTKETCGYKCSRAEGHGGACRCAVH